MKGADVGPEDVRVIVERIRPLLAGYPPELQGAALADLLAMWLAGHPDHVREAVLQTHLRFVRELISVNERMIFGGSGHPHSRN